MRKKTGDIHLKTREEIALMREAGRVVAQVHQAMRQAAAPGVSTGELDAIAVDVIRRHGAEPAFLHYVPFPGMTPYPATITACINEELVHGIPSDDRKLAEGDLLSLDVGVFYQGWVGDAAFSMGVGAVSDAVQRLLDVTEKALDVAIDASRPGNTTRDVAVAVQAYVESFGYTVPRDYGGHGIGRAMHEPPSIPNWAPKLKRRFRGVELKPGMTYALEPMVISGDQAVKVLGDRWTVVTEDGSLCAHFEHSVAITDGEPVILSLI